MSWNPTSNLLAVALIGILAVTSCTAIHSSHGYVPDETDLATIQVGVSEKGDVLLAAGQPAVTNAQYGESWFYIQSQFRQMGYREAEIVDRHVVVVSFSDSGHVSNVERYGLEDGRIVALSRRVTETNLGRLSIVEQFLRSLGRIDPSELINRN